jgi:hypothetical protein
MNAKTYVDLCHGHKYYHNQRFPMKHKSFLKQNNNKPKFKSRSQHKNTKHGHKFTIKIGEWNFIQNME